MLFRSPEEKEDYNWYIYAENDGPDVLSSWINIGVNDEPETKHVRFKSDEDIPGSKQIDPTYLIENTMNYFSIHGGDSDMDKVNFQVVALLPTQDPVDIPSMLKERPYNLKVKVWR